MNEDRLHYLLKKYQKGTCTKEEWAELNIWYESLNYDLNDLEVWVKELTGEKELANSLYHRFTTKMEKQKKTIIWNRSVAAIAALMILFIGTIFLIHQHPFVTEKKAAANLLPAANLHRNKAILTLADGSTLILEDKKNGQIASQSGINIINSSGGELLYDFSSKVVEHDNDTKKTLYNSIYTPRGGQYKVVLPDGSKVWLNSDSKINFPVADFSKERKVILSGEAYFEIQPMVNIPFKVLSDNQEIQVLGTHFNVKAYPDEDVISTTLLEGSVSVKNNTSTSNFVLVPGQQANLHKENSIINIQQADLDEAVSWKNGYFLFDNQNIKQIMTTIGRWYDADVVFEHINPDEKFGGTFSRSSDLQDILDNLEGLGHVKFVVNNKTIIVKED